MKAKIVDTPFGPCLKLRYKKREISISADGETAVYQHWNRPEDNQKLAVFQVRGPRGVFEARFFIDLFNKGLIATHL